MSVNSSSSLNSSLPPSPLSSSVSFFDYVHSCFSSTAGALGITIFTITSILVLLPLYILVLYLGFQRWRQQHSGMTMSHSDLFTYHMVIIEVMSVLGSSLLCCGVHTDLPLMMMVGIYLLSINLFGQMLFHLLTCVERYLAVVHPITYLSLRTAKGVRIRNITIGCVWLLCFAGTGSMSMKDQVSFNISSYCIICFILIVILFCSLSVLCVLIHPGPGEGGGGRQQVDQSKLRAFYTITAILGVLLFRFGGNILGTALYDTPLLGESGRCGVLLSVVWFCLPSSLLLPLLFLHRAGQLACCRHNTESGQGSN